MGLTVSEALADLERAARRYVTGQHEGRGEIRQALVDLDDARTMEKVRQAAEGSDAREG